MSCRPSLWRGAWIETDGHRRPHPPLPVAPLFGGGRGLKPSGPGIASSASSRPSLWRGAWIETGRRRAGATTRHRRPSLWRGAWIETLARRPVAGAWGVAPLFGGGRGLKLELGEHAAGGLGRPSLWRGAWIETGHSSRGGWMDLIRFSRHRVKSWPARRDAGTRTRLGFCSPEMSEVSLGCRRLRCTRRSLVVPRRAF